MKKLKEVTNQQFDRLSDVTIRKLNDSQVDRLWETLRVEIRRRYFNSGLRSAMTIVEAENSVMPIDPAVQNTLQGVLKKISYKTWNKN